MTTTTGVGPYRYLDHFQEPDRPTFAGREDDIAEVVAAATSDDPFVLYARSGLGKTSLLLAGVFPILRERGLRPVYIRVQDDAALEFRNAIAAELKIECSERREDVLELVRKASSETGLVLVFDQFEEFFINTRGDTNARLAFIRLLGAVANDEHTDVRLTFSLREDYLAELDDLRDVFPTILANQYRLRPLTAFGARQAIVTPLIEAGIPFDQQLVVRLVDLLATVEFDSALLQIACGEVYKEALARDKNVRLTEADLDRIGGLDGLFERMLDNAIGQIPQNQLLLSRAVLDALVTPEDTKRQVVLEALLTNEDFQGSREEIESVLNCLKRQRIVRSDFRRNALWYELSHDRLVPFVVKWFKVDPDFAQFRGARDLISETSRRAAFPERLETLLSAPQIEKLIGPYRDRIKLNDTQRALLFWSAVNSRVIDVGYWATRFGQPGCCEALLKLLAHASPDARLGAALAVERMAARLPGLAEQCLKMALEDENADVRRAAAKALSKIVDADQLDALRAALGARRTRRRALDVVAEFAHAGVAIDSFQSWWRYAARQRARHRALDDCRLAISARGKRGAVVGLIAAIGWMATIGAALVSAAMWSAGDTRWVRNAFFFASATGAILGVIGVLYGWLIGRSGARVAVAKGAEGHWASALLRPLPFIAGGMGLPLLCAILLKTCRPAVWPPERMNFPTRIGWSMLFGLPIGLPFLALAASAREFEFWEILRVALILSALPTIAALVLSETALLAPIGEFHPTRRVWRVGARSALLVIALMVPAGFLWQFGRDSLPVGLDMRPINEPQKIPLHFRSGMDSTYFRLASAPDDVPWVVLNHPPGVRVRTRTADIARSNVDGSQQLLFVPQGRHLVSATSDGLPGEGSLTLTPLPLLNDDTTIMPNAKGWTIHVLRLKRSDPDGKSKVYWSGTVRPRVAKQLITRGMTVRVLPLPGLAIPNGTLGTARSEVDQVTAPPIPYGVSASIDTATFIAKTATELPGELRPTPVNEEDGSFTVTLTYRPSDVTGKTPPPVLHVPIALALKETTVLEKFALSAEGTPSFVTFLRNNPAIWNDATQLNDLSYRAAELNKLDEAIELRKRVVELQPKSANALNQLAWAYVLAAQGQEARPLARMAVELSNGKLAYILDTAAHAEFLVENWRQAADDWDAVLRLEPNYYSEIRDPECTTDSQLIAEARRKAGLPEKAYKSSKD